LYKFLNADGNVIFKKRFLNTILILNNN